MRCEDVTNTRCTRCAVLFKHWPHSVCPIQPTTVCLGRRPIPHKPTRTACTPIPSFAMRSYDCAPVFFKSARAQVIATRKLAITVVSVKKVKSGVSCS